MIAIHLFSIIIYYFFLNIQVLFLFSFIFVYSLLFFVRATHPGSTMDA